MNDNYSEATEAALDAAEAFVSGFVAEHGVAAIPAIVTACMGWSVRNGEGELVQQTFRATAEIVPQAIAAWRRELS